MEIVKKITVEFTGEEQDTINRMLSIVDEFSNSDACDEISCHHCPFNGLCDYREGSADSIKQQLNSTLHKS